MDVFSQRDSVVVEYHRFVISLSTIRAADIRHTCSPAGSSPFKAAC